MNRRRGMLQNGEAQRSLRPYFYTTNVDKYLQARSVFRQFQLPLHHLRRSERPYDEDYSRGTEGLLEAAVRELVRQRGDSTLLFIEDTSLRIEALSSGTSDFPGLKVKEWFSTARFNDVDAALRRRGNDRRVVVKSDIALHVPGLQRPVFFHGEVSGTIAEQLPPAHQDERYPWLTTGTFNGWFVPVGCDRTLAELPYEQSLQHDFRARALTKLAQRLQEYTAIINSPAPQRTYRRVPVKRPGEKGMRLFGQIAAPFIVVGYSCAGKTTFGEYVASNYAGLTIEASDALREGIRIPRQSDTLDSPFSYAKEAMAQLGSDVVARYILEVELRGHGDEPFVVTGFRTLEELLTLKEAIPHTRLVWIEAPSRQRFERHLQRKRADSLSDYEAFDRRDEAQSSFGLLPVGEELADIVVENIYELEHYYRQVESVVAIDAASSVQGVHDRSHHTMELGSHQLYKCLISLREAGRPLTTDEIERLSGEHGVTVRHNNANKVLKAHAVLADRLEVGSDRIRYRITSAGQAYLRLLELRARSRTGDGRS